MDIVQLAKPGLTPRQRVGRAAAVAAAGALVIGVWELGARRAQRPQAKRAIRPFLEAAAPFPAPAAAATLVAREVTVRGVRIHYAEGGTGPPVVFCHGWLDNHRVWFRNLPALATLAHVYAIDWPGFGLSDKPADAPYDPAYQADMLLGFLDALHLERVSLVAHSMGGHWTTLFLLQHPDRVDRYVGVASAAMLAGPPGYRLPLTRTALRWYFGRRAARQDKEAARIADWTRLLLHSEVITPEFVEQVSDFDTRGDPASVPVTVATLDGVLRTPLRRHAHRIETPTLLVWGGRDRTVPPRVGRLHARTLSDARLLIFEDSGHDPFLQEAARFNRAVATFLGLNPDAQPGT